LSWKYTIWQPWFSLSVLLGWQFHFFTLVKMRKSGQSLQDLFLFGKNGHPVPSSRELSLAYKQFLKHILLALKKTV
jgi:hypothetical protein